MLASEHGARGIGQRAVETYSPAYVDLNAEGKGNPITFLSTAG